MAVCKPLGRGGFGGELATPTPVPVQSHPLLLSASLICLNLHISGLPRPAAHPRESEAAVGLVQARKTKENLKIRRKPIKVILFLIFTMHLQS